MARLLIAAGCLLIVAGLAIWLGLPLGRLPGDFQFRRGAFTVYIPLATSLVVSLVLTLFLMLIRR